MKKMLENYQKLQEMIWKKLMNGSDLHVQMEYTLQMHELDAFAYLAHENGAGPLGQDEVVVDHSLEQFATFDPVQPHHQNQQKKIVHSNICSQICVVVVADSDTVKQHDRLDIGFIVLL